MNPSVGAGWRIHSISDRIVELRKDDHAYRRFTGRDGFVRTRVEPDMTRAQALEAAIRMAQENDERLAVKVASRLLPDKAKLAHFQGRQVRLAHVFGVKGEEGRVFKP